MKTVARSISQNVLVCSGLQPRWLQTRGITLGGESGSLLWSERYRHDTDVYPRENCIVFYISRVSPEAKSNAVTLRIKYGIIPKKVVFIPIRLRNQNRINVQWLGREHRGMAQA